MIKYVSFSLFGNQPKYLAGLQKNLLLIQDLYKDWQPIVYYDDSVPQSYIHDVLSKIKSINVGDTKAVATMWRFFVHDENDCERFIIRDADSRISQREVNAVNQWIESEKILHIMRDHPHHGYVIMGGMWGMIPQNINMRKECEQYIIQRNTNKWSMTDMDFLRDIIYPKYHNNSKIHATYAKFEDWAEDFPTPLIDKKFVGEIWQANDTRDYQYTLL